MALTDIVAPPGNKSTLLFSRGDTGIVLDIQSKDENMMYLPEVVNSGGGNIFIMSE